MKLPVLAASVTASTSPPPSAAAPLPSGAVAPSGFSVEGLNRLHALIQGYVDRGDMAGLVTLIARDGKVVDVRTYGLRDRATKKPMTRDTLFRVASMTKIVTAVAVLTLFDDGKIGLDDPVGHYLPELKHLRVLVGLESETPRYETARPITLRQLLTHTSGIAAAGPFSERLRPAYEEVFERGFSSLQDLVAALARLPLCNQPGDAMHYGGSYEVLGRLVEVVSGEPFDQYVRHRVTGPLGMRDTFFQIPAVKQERLALTYVRKAGMKLNPRAVSDSAYFLGGEGCPRGSGGLVSTADDFARLGQMLLNGGELDGVRVLKAPTVQLMTSDQLTTLREPNTFQPPFESYGFGVSVRLPVPGPPGSVGQFGWSGAWTTYCTMDPQEGTIVILLSQHAPWNEDAIFEKFSAACYAAIEKKR